MLVKRFNYLAVQAAIVLAAVAAAFLSPRPRDTTSTHVASNTTAPIEAVAEAAKATVETTRESARPTTPNAALKPEVRTIARAERASFVAQLEFKPKSFDLTATAQRLLADTVQRARRTGRIDKFHLIVWADHEYPSSERKHLTQDDIRLADRRAKAVNDFLKERSPDAITDAYNMAERPNALQSILPTTDARIKRSLEAAGIPTTAGDVRTPEYASKTFVLVLLAD